MYAGVFLHHQVTPSAQGRYKGGSDLSPSEGRIAESQLYYCTGLVLGIYFLHVGARLGRAGVDP